MVTDITSLTGNGLKDWLIQRVTALYFAIYSLSLCGILFFHSSFNFQTWHALFHATFFQIATILAWVAFVLHAWIGLWTVSTDYIKCTVLRISMQLLILLILCIELIMGIMMIWGR